MKEIWKSITHYRDYQISNLGRVRSLPKQFRRFLKIIKPMIDKAGYYRITLWKNSEYKRFLIHRLVAEMFVSNNKNKPTVNHLDNNPSNNIFNNLEWCTQSENMLHAFRTKSKVMPKGEDCYGHKVTEKEVKNIRKYHKKRVYNMRELAEMYNLSKPTVWKMIHRQTWRHI